MILRRFGIFGKVFLYTLLFLLIAISVTVAVFAQQFKDFYDYLQLKQYSSVFEPLKVKMVDSENLKNVIQTADEFHSKNQSFAFNIETKDGIVVYKTVKATEAATIGAISAPVAGKATAESIQIQKFNMGLTDTFQAIPGLDKTKKGIVIALNNGLVVRTLIENDQADLFGEFSNKAFLIAFFLLCASIIGALLFARGITKPIRKLAEDTRSMASLEPVPIPAERFDEVGQLASDVHHMYEKLKQTIARLETEITREKEMEENQRYFFSAASHELKTPIAATSALLEGMLADIGDYKNHPKYLRECLNMMKSQNRTINEILKIVSLSDERILPQKADIHLLSVINDLLPEYNTLAEKKSQRITVNVAETVTCNTDKKMLGTVLSNVIMNAVQNSPGGEEIRIWSESADNGSVRLYILNTNASIDQESKAKLYEPFYREDKARSRKEERSGLGLTLVKKILDSMEIPFDLEMRSSDVVFWLDLPV